MSLRAISDFFVCGGWEETPHAYEGMGRGPRARERVFRDFFLLESFLNSSESAPNRFNHLVIIMLEESVKDVKIGESTPAGEICRINLSYILLPRGNLVYLPYN